MLAIGCLVLAVTAMGGEVVVSPGGLSPEQVLKTVRAAKARRDKPAFALGFKSWDFASAGLRK